MKCTQITLNLCAYIDGELSIDEASLVESHVRECAKCAAELEELQESQCLLDLLPQPIEPPRWIWLEVREQLFANAPSKERRAAIAQLLRPVFQRPWQIAAASACLMLAASAIFGISRLPNVLSNSFSSIAQTTLRDVSKADEREILTALSWRYILPGEQDAKDESSSESSDKLKELGGDKRQSRIEAYQTDVIV